MKDEELKIPFYVKATIFFIGSFALVTILYLLRGIIVPLIFATIIAIVLHPVVNFFIRMRINRVLAITITMLLAFLVIAAFVGLIISQANRFSETWPILVDKFTALLNHAITWASGYLDIKPKEIHEWIIKTQGELINTSADALKQTLVTVGTGIMVLLLIPFYDIVVQMEGSR